MISLVRLGPPLEWNVDQSSVVGLVQVTLHMAIPHRHLDRADLLWLCVIK